MGLATSTSLTIPQLRQLANDATGTLANLDAVLSSLGSTDEETMNWAAEALENCGPPSASAVPTLQRYLTDSNPAIALWACKLAARLGEQAASTQPQLALMLGPDKPVWLREEASVALGKIGPLSPTTKSLLEQAAKDGSPRLKRVASAALAH